VRHRWITRFRDEGETGPADRSSKPHHCPTHTPVEVEEAIVLMRRAERRGQDWIGPELGIPVRTVSRVRAGPRGCEEGRQGPRRRRLARSRTRDGFDPAKKNARIGYDYVHSMVGDHSRLAYSEILQGEQGPICAGFIARAAASFATFNITRIEQVMTDNHWSYAKSTDVAEVITALEAKHVFIKPHFPWQNGKVERVNRTLQVEWAYRRVFLSNADRAAALAPWLTTTTLDVATPHSEDVARPAACYQPDGLVHLAASQSVSDSSLGTL
jgi:hypothetical protein